MVSAGFRLTSDRPLTTLRAPWNTEIERGKHEVSGKSSPAGRQASCRQRGAAFASAYGDPQGHRDHLQRQGRRGPCGAEGCPADHRLHGFQGPDPPQQGRPPQEPAGCEGQGFCQGLSPRGTEGSTLQARDAGLFHFRLLAFASFLLLPMFLAVVLAGRRVLRADGAAAWKLPFSSDSRPAATSSSSFITASERALVPSPVAPDIRNAGPLKRSCRTILPARSRASSAGRRSILFSTSQRGLVPRSALNFFSSPTMARASFTGSASGSSGAMSIRCSSTRVRCRCFRKRWPRPAPSAAPSIRPGMSAITKLRCWPTSTTPRLGYSVVKG